jgi:hypothetical protein
MAWDFNSENARKLLSFGLALLLLSANAIVGLHHHHDSGEHHSCAVCVVVHHSQAKLSSPSLTQHYLPAVVFISAPLALPSVNTFEPSPIRQRAPPHQALPNSG